MKIKDNSIMNRLLCFLLVILLIGFLFENKSKEHFSPGTDIQLLTSKPYYTWYDYITQMRKYPYEYGYGNDYGYGYNPFYYPNYF